MFTFIEKASLSKILYKFGGELGKLDNDQKTFLREENLLRFQRNYAIIPKSSHRKTGAENIVIISTLEGNFDIQVFVREILDSLTPPFRIQIDFGVLLRHPLRGDFRYLWPLRYTALDIHPLIKNDNDREVFFSRFLDTNISEDTLERHREQCHFDGSGFSFNKFLTTSVFLSKIY